MKRECIANKDIAQLIVNHRQRKWEIAATLVFVCAAQVTETSKEWLQIRLI